MKNSYGVGAAGPVFTLPDAVPPQQVPGIDWTAILNGLVNAGVSYLSAQQQIEAQKRAAAAAAAAGNSYNFPSSWGGGAGGMSQYMPYLIGGAVLIGVLFFLKRK